MAQIIDSSKVGKRGFPMHWKELGLHPPMMDVPDAQAPAPPPLSIPPTKAQLLAYAANKRWQKETGGTTINGILVPTDDRAKLLILGATLTLADGDSAPFIAGGVNYGMLTGAQFKAINSAIVTFVQATFVTLAAVISAINAGSTTTIDQIDAAFAA